MAAALFGCEGPLPDAESPGARVYQARCGGCHRAFAPGSMTFAMWQMQVDRMRELFARRGVGWPGPDDERLLMDYLRDHAGHA